MHSVISTLTDNIEAIDLSYNRIEYLPNSLPKSIIGLNLAHNKIVKLLSGSNQSLSKDLNHLMELNLSHNHLSK
jgi:Leucine-rich repeat (LRR) protein